MTSVKFSQAFYSTAIVLASGLAAVLFFQLELFALGILGWWSIPLGLVVGAFFYGLIFELVITVFVQFSPIQLLTKKVSNLYRNFSWPSILIISVMAGLSEELLFRGILQTSLIGVTNSTIGIVLASLIFGLMHFFTITYIIVTFFVGLAFGVAYYLSDSLVFVIIAHAIYDVLALAALVKYPKRFAFADTQE